MGQAHDLVGALRMEEVGPNRYRAPNMATHQSGGVVFGAQLLAQLVSAAGAADPAKQVKSAHAVFVRPAVIEEPVEIQLDVVQSGRSFTSLDATTWQRDRVCARALVLLDAPDADFFRHRRAMADVPGPEDVVATTDGFPGREVRPVQAAGGDGTRGEPTMLAWLRFPDAPDDRAIRQGLVAHSAGAFVLVAIMGAHPEVSTEGAHSSLSVAIMTQTLTFHEEVHPDEWLLVEIASPYAGLGRTYGRGDVYDRDGVLVASFAEDGMVRPFDQQQAAKVGVATRI